MDITNMTLDLNKILRPFITRITALESTVLKLQAALDKTNTISKHVRPVVREVPSKPTPAVRNSYAAIVESTTRDTVMNPAMTKQPAMCLSATVRPVKMPMPVSAPNPKLFYAPAKSPERQARMARGECFGCGQKGHTQKSCPTHSFEKIRPLLNPEMNRPMNPVPRTDVKTNMKPPASSAAKIMKPTMKPAAKPVTNMNTRTNLSENTRTASTKEIRIVLPATPRTTSPDESENESS